MSLILAPATITRVRTLHEGELRGVELTLPVSLRVGAKDEPIEDGMRPGAAFLTEPFGGQSKKYHKQLYMRSNCSISSQRRLETVWWQTGEIHEGDTIGVRVDADPKGNFLRVHEHRILDQSKSLALEPDTWWSEQNFVAVAFSTGIAPFLAHIRYMALFGFGRGFVPCNNDPRRRAARPVFVISVLITTESLILAQNERWRRGLGMQVERERGGNSSSRVANG